MSDAERPAAASHPHARPVSRMAQPRYRIGEAARQVGVSPSVLRQWERQGLVGPMRTPSRYRLYSDEDMRLLRRVRAMRAERVNAPGIRRLLADQAPASDGEHRPDGTVLRALRSRRGLSLRDAARASGVSTSLISGLERNATAASVATLQRLTSVYGSTVLQLFERRRMGRLVHPTERPTLELGGPGVRIEQLSDGSGSLEPQLFVLAPAATSDGAYSHAGEEFLFVLAGSVTVWVGERERYRLREGDALSFPSTLPHRWRNAADRETRLLWINTPPTF